MIRAIFSIFQICLIGPLLFFVISLSEASFAGEKDKKANGLKVYPIDEENPYSPINFGRSAKESASPKIMTDPAALSVSPEPKKKKEARSKREPSITKPASEDLGYVPSKLDLGGSSYEGRLTSPRVRFGRLKLGLPTAHAFPESPELSKSFRVLDDANY